MVWGIGDEWLTRDPASDLPSGFVERFAASMPLGYRVLFDPRSTRRHAATAFRRGTRLAHAEVWGTLTEPSAALCVVADDRPGLLSAIAAALVSHRLEVITALVFSRTAEGGAREAVDLFWVRRADTKDYLAIDAGDATSITEVLCALLAGDVRLSDVASSPPPVLSTKERPISVRYEPDEGELAVLFVEAPDRPGMLLTIARELYKQGAQIARSLVRTAEGRAFNRFDLSEFSGARLTPERREQIRAAIHAAVALGDEEGPPA